MFHSFIQFDVIFYSKSTDALFCAECILFLMPAHRSFRANSLITQPYHNWKDTKEDTKNHCTLQYHKDSIEILRGFVKNHKNLENHKDLSINTKKVKTVKK